MKRSAGLSVVAALVVLAAGLAWSPEAVRADPGNLALNRPASASSIEFPGAEAARAVDGSPSTRWSSLFIVPSWISVDLGARYAVSRVKLSWEAAYASAYQVQVSDDTVSWQTIYATTSGTGGVVDLTGLVGSGRYVRVLATAKATVYGVSLWEFEAYGTLDPGGGPPPPTTNLALNRPASASSIEFPGAEAARAVDGSPSTRWSSLFIVPSWISVDLGARYAVSRVKLSWEAAYASAYQVQVSDDTVSWQTIYATTSGTGGVVDLTGLVGSGRYVRVLATAKATVYGVSLWEFEAYGTPDPLTTGPAQPTITEPSTDGQVVNPADVHMEQGTFVHSNPLAAHACTDWIVQVHATSEVVWQSPCNSAEKTHIHLGDGAFVGSLAGQTEFAFDTQYDLRVRNKDDSGIPATEWGPWATRLFRTSLQPAPGGSTAWTVRQPGYVVEAVAGGLTLPVNIAFVPNPGTGPTDPFFYVTELYGNIKVVARDGTVTDYVNGILNYPPSGIFPGSGEQGLTGIVVDPATGDVFVSMSYEASPGVLYAKVVRFQSSHNGALAEGFTTILDMVGDPHRASHTVSNLTIGPDGKLYVHVGDAFEATTWQNLDSFRAKILRVNLDGSPPTDNPFYNPALGTAARNYVYAYGFRNPFGGIWRAADGAHYTVENGPSRDRFAQIVAGRNYLYNGTDASMSNHALYNWQPSVAPVNVAFIQAATFGGSGFPTTEYDHAFVSESGSTYASGPQINGKRISEFVLDAQGNLVSGPTPLIEYTGTGKATVAALAAGPDGLYFSELYKDTGSTATEIGARVLRVRYDPGGGPPPPTTNLALNRPASASSIEFPGAEAARAVDGSPSTRWSSLFIVPSWISVDLGARYAVSRVKLSWEAAYASAYQVQVSDDTVSWQTIYATTSGTGGVVDLTGLVGSGRYVRVLATAKATVYGVSLWEFEAYGTLDPGGGPPPPTTNLALNRPASASSIEFPGAEAARAVDGSPSTRWSSLFIVPSWISVDLGARYAVSRVKLSWEAAYASAYQVQVSDDTVSWQTIYATTSGTGGVVDLTGLVGSGRYVRVLATAKATVYGVSLWEFEAYGTPS